MARGLSSNASVNLENGTSNNRGDIYTSNSTQTLAPDALTNQQNQRYSVVGQILQFLSPVRNFIFAFYGIALFAFLIIVITVIVIIVKTTKKMDAEFDSLNNIAIQRMAKIENDMHEIIVSDFPNGGLHNTKYISEDTISYNLETRGTINADNTLGSKDISIQSNEINNKILNQLEEKISKFSKDYSLKSRVSTSKIIMLSEIGGILNEVVKIDKDFDPIDEANIIVNFKLYASEYNRVFDSNSDFVNRYMIFRNNFIEIKTHNANPKKTYTKGINVFSDRSDSEINNILSINFADVAPNLRSLEEISTPREFLKEKVGVTVVDVKERFDWRDQDVISPVRAQQGCGSCWAIAAAGAIDAVYNIKNKGSKMITSPQHLMNCVSDEFTCQTGGVVRMAIEYAQVKGGVCVESDVPYVAEKQKCETKACKQLVTISKYFKVPANKMQSVLKDKGPIAAAMAITKDFLQYESGVYNGSCNKVLNHAMLITGYGYDDSVNSRYWIFKNSWGSNWGKDGYVYVSRDTEHKDSFCQINLAPYVAVM